MLTTIQDAVTQLLPAKRKTASNGWTSFNAPCCHHNGESSDTRSRGGIISNAGGGVSYHCFNCQFKASYTPGYHLNYKFRKLLSWLGADDNTVRRLVIDAVRIKDIVGVPDATPVERTEFSIKPRPLPEEARDFHALNTFYTLNNDRSIPNEAYNAVEYIQKRKIDLEKYSFYWTPETAYNLHRRVIIPFTWKNEIIGYTARATEDGIKPKYHNSHEPNYVFNVDRQLPDSKFVIVTEGPFDAMSVDGVAVLSNYCNETQADVIDALGREVILVPDFDIKIDERTGKRTWSGAKLIDNAIEYGWTVSFPVWQETCKDANDAVIKYGKLFVIKSILEAKQTSKLKIELMKKRMSI
jgi:hypothetical protein